MKLLYGVVLVFGILLALVTLHGFKSVGDPVTPIGILDKLSFIMGVHDKQAVTVLHIGKFLDNTRQDAGICAVIGRDTRQKIASNLSVLY